MKKTDIKYLIKWILIWGLCGAAFGLILSLMLRLFDNNISLLKFTLISAAAGAVFPGYIGGLILLVRKD